MKKLTCLLSSLVVFTILFSVGTSAVKTIHASLSYLTITKVDEANPSKKLEGAVFEVRSEDGQHVETVTTNSEGVAIIALNPMVYYVTEVKAPEGYEILASSKNIRVDGSKSEPLALTIENKAVAVKENTNETVPETVPETGYDEMILVLTLGVTFLTGGFYLVRKARHLN